MPGTWGHRDISLPREVLCLGTLLPRHRDPRAELPSVQLLVTPALRVGGTLWLRCTGEGTTPWPPSCSPRGHPAHCEAAGVGGTQQVGELPSPGLIFPPPSMIWNVFLLLFFFNDKAKQRNHHSGTRLGAKPQLPAHHSGGFTRDTSPQGARGPNGGRIEAHRGMQHP